MRPRSAGWEAPTAATRWPAPRPSRYSTPWKGDQIPERGARLGERIRCALPQMGGAVCPQIGDVRGLGAMVAMELVTDRTDQGSRQGADRQTAGRGAQARLILLSAGTLGNVMRVLVPLTVEDAVLDEGLDVMEGRSRSGGVTSMVEVSRDHRPSTIDHARPHPSRPPVRSRTAALPRALIPALGPSSTALSDRCSRACRCTG